MSPYTFNQSFSRQSMEDHIASGTATLLMVFKKILPFLQFLHDILSGLVLTTSEKFS